MARSSLSQKKISSKVAKNGSHKKLKEVKSLAENTTTTKQEYQEELSIEQIKSTYQNIKASAKGINDIVVLIQGLEYFYNVLTSNTSGEALVDKYEGQCRLLIFSIFKTFENLIKSLKLKNSVKRETDDKKVLLNKWLKARYESYKSILLSFFKDFKFDSEILIDSLELYMKLMQLESEYWAPKSSEETYFPTQTYEEAVESIFLSSKNGEILSDGSNNSILAEFFINSYLNKFKDLKYYFLVTILNILEKQKEILNDSGIRIFYSKWLGIIQEDFFQSIFNSGSNDEEENKSDISKGKEDSENLGFLDDNSLEDEDDDDSVIDASDSEEFELNDTFVSNPPVSVQKYTLYKSLFTKCWFLVLSLKGILTSQLKTTLLVMHKRVVPYLVKPERLMDFLTFCYDDNESLIIQILALNGLFQLMEKKNLEYPSFYEKLYHIFSNPEVLTNRYRSRFFRLVDLFLSSTHLPASIVASFIKRMARLSIVSNPGGAVIVIPFTYNLLKRHPSCMILIHNPLLEGEELENYIDPFNNEEPNPALTNAIESSLWELETLASHYHPNVATLAKIFSNPFTKASYNIEDFLDWNYKSLLDSENSRRIKGEHMMALEFETWNKVFADEKNEDSPAPSYVGSWNF